MRLCNSRVGLVMQDLYVIIYHLKDQTKLDSTFTTYHTYIQNVNKNSSKTNYKMSVI